MLIEPLPPGAIGLQQRLGWNSKCCSSEDAPERRILTVGEKYFLKVSSVSCRYAWYVAGLTFELVSLRNSETVR